MIIQSTHKVHSASFGVKLIETNRKYFASSKLLLCSNTHLVAVVPDVAATSRPDQEEPTDVMVELHLLLQPDLERW